MRLLTASSPFSDSPTCPKNKSKFLIVGKNKEKMITKREKIIIGIGLFLLVTTIASMAYRLDRVWQTSEQTKHRMETLDFQLGAELLNDKDQEFEINELKNQNDKLTQVIEQLIIKNKIGTETITTLESDYRMAISYISMAEYILSENEIEFYYTGRR